MFVKKFPLGHEDIVQKNVFEGNWAQGHKCNTNCFNNTLTTNCKGKCFLL
jgi:hypothetical protein